MSPTMVIIIVEINQYIDFNFNNEYTYIYLNGVVPLTTKIVD
jgi:hypothetical protein